MRTMFPSHDKNIKKKFQKPNILRKKPRKEMAKPNLLEADESLNAKTLVSRTTTKDINVDGMLLDTGTSQEAMLDLKAAVATNFVDAYDGSESNATQTDESGFLFNSDLSVVEHREPQNDGDNSDQPMVNIESFFNESAGEKYMLFDLEPGKPVETLVVIDDESPVSGVVSAVYVEQIPDPSAGSMPVPDVAGQAVREAPPQEVTNLTAFQNYYSQFTQTVKFKCDIGDCNKEFRSEQKFKRHKNTHDKDGSIKAPRHVTIQCPVKTVEADGTEKACGSIFLVRELLLQHLNEDHTLDDAFYKCEECGRRFFWASGLRAHVRAHCRRSAGASPAVGAGGPGGAGGLVCGWPGCGRVFRQPCRLREHARAHTGDRPYPCQYPNCGWSFRSASKLMRHARRHTGERRHACASCGRAFLRREHLREHTARHHAPRAPQPCTRPGCEQTFSNMSTLYMHMKKVHNNKSEETFTPTAATTETFYALEPDAPDSNNMFNMVNLPEVSTIPVEETGTFSPALAVCPSEPESEPDEWHSARTHCTWPLQRAPAPTPTVGDHAHAHALKDDEQVEQSEGSESNTYTVRSDLFLHGNVLINEDSEHMHAAGAELGSDLGLMDAHPTIDLMQEELMYADTAADESSFRIFLLSGEELT